MKLALYGHHRGWFIAPADMENAEALQCRVSPFYLHKAAAERNLADKQDEYNAA